MNKIMVIVGTRPEVIKLAPVVHTLRARAGRDRVVLCSTGQHRQMLADALGALELEPDLDLELMREAQHPTDLLGRLLQALRPVLQEIRPDVLVVQGDTTTVMGAALAGCLDNVKVAHVEAGLRTQDKRMPFPEEINRRVTGVVADFHFAPTTAARDALLAERVPPETVFVTGNTIVDALRWARDRVGGRPAPITLRPGSRLVLVTAHRRESFGEPFRQLCLALREIAERHPDIEMVYPVHLNPAVQEPVREILGGCDRVRLIEPLNYTAFVSLLVRAHLILTDSGGVQEEAPSIGKPVLVLREKTERPEGVATGVVKLVGTDRAKIVGEASRLLSDKAAYEAMAREVNVYGDGLAATRISEVLLEGDMTTPPFCGT
ncbi:MAG: UDP-N-acetyl glucosamine 2-epimerase [Phycisphaerae bacterium]